MIIAELEREIALKELQLENYAGLKREFDIRKEEDLLRLLRHLKPIALERYSPEPTVKTAPFELPGVTVDWDFYNANWALDTQVYVSAPSALRLNNPNYALLKQGAVNIAIKNGRIETYIRHTGNFVLGAARALYFRATYPDGSFSGGSAYFIGLGGTSTGSGVAVDTAGLGFVSDGSGSTFTQANITPSIRANTWYKIRVTWWESSGVLVARLEYYNGEQWAPLCPDFTDNQNRNASSSTLRVGVGNYFASSYAWYDDTVIYVAV